jgi:hypothetical protein
VNGQFYLGVMEWLLERIRVHPEFHNSKVWFLLHDSASAHTTGAVVRFLERKQVTVLHHVVWQCNTRKAGLYVRYDIRTIKVKTYFIIICHSSMMACVPLW